MTRLSHVWMILAMLLVGTAARANEEDAEKHAPCKKILEACKGAGFTKGDHKNGKGLFMDCLDPILQGKAVAGVTADAADVTACNEKKAAHKGKKK